MENVPTHSDKPKRTLKVLIPFDATREQIEQAVEMLFGPDPEKQKPPLVMIPVTATDEELEAIAALLNAARAQAQKQKALLPETDGPQGQ